MYTYIHLDINSCITSKKFILHESTSILGLLLKSKKRKKVEALSKRGTAFSMQLI